MNVPDATVIVLHPVKSVVVVVYVDVWAFAANSTTAPVSVFTLVTGAPGIHAATFVLVIVGEPVAVLHVATTSIASVAVVSIVHVELVCIAASPGVNVEPVPSKMQLAIWVPLAPVVRVVTAQRSRHTPFVTLAIWTTAPVVIRIVPPIFSVTVRLAGVAGVV